MGLEEDLKQEMGDAANAHSGTPLRRMRPLAGDDDHASRLIALETNVQRLERGLILLARKLDERG
jgi:hypothetical protein